MTTEKKRKIWEILNYKTLIVATIIGLGFTAYSTFFKPKNDTEISKTKSTEDTAKNVHSIEQGKGAIIDNSYINQQGKDSGIKIIKMGDSSKIKKTKILQ